MNNNSFLSWFLLGVKTLSHSTKFLQLFNSKILELQNYFCQTQQAGHKCTNITESGINFDESKKCEFWKLWILRLSWQWLWRIPSSWMWCVMWCGFRDLFSEYNCYHKFSSTVSSYITCLWSTHFLWEVSKHCCYTSKGMHTSFWQQIQKCVPKILPQNLLRMA